jgi:hypothetical protein
MTIVAPDCVLGVTFSDEVFERGESIAIRISPELLMVTPI